METIILNIKKILKENSHSYSSKGISKNLDIWSENKKELINILRKHPDWCEEALAVVMEFEEVRQVSISDTYNALFDLEMLHPLFQNLCKPRIYESNEFSMFSNALYTAISPFEKFISKDTADKVKEYANIQCSCNEKTSKVIHKICEAFKVNQNPNFEKVYAKLSNCINPYVIKRTAVLSVNPCDYLLMSVSSDDTWTSCHNVYDRSYMAGTLSYLNDPSAMVFYILDEERKNITNSIVYDYKKIKRQMYFYSDGTLLCSRLYPDHDSKMLDQLEGYVKNIISVCLESINEWKIEDSVSEYIETRRYSLHYRDYEYNYYTHCYLLNIFILKGGR